MKRFLSIFLISAFFTGVFLFGFHKGYQPGQQENFLSPPLPTELFSKNIPFQKFSGENEETWVYGIKTKFDVQERVNTDIVEAAGKFKKDFEDEGFLSEIMNGDYFYYVFGVSTDKKSGKSVTLIKNEDDDSLTVISSTHFLDESDHVPPELPRRIKEIFGYVDLKTAIYSRTPESTMLVFPYNISRTKALDLITRKMKEMGYVQDRPGSGAYIKSNLMYFIRGSRECFFEVNPIDSSSVNILTVEYPR
ncbi:MAG: hypothetical protein JW928_00900 [Candidatus Aureabacteria bacterium]|nr:hypothetical protein [Candidatus Auribacterota bacterium]